jgi:hypothetical protein
VGCWNDLAGEKAVGLEQGETPGPSRRCGRSSAAPRLEFDAGSGQAKGRRAAGTNVVIGATATTSNCSVQF